MNGNFNGIRLLRKINSRKKYSTARETVLESFRVAVEITIEAMSKRS